MSADPFLTGSMAGNAAARAWIAAGKPIEDLLAAAVELSHTRGSGPKARERAGYGLGVRLVLEKAQGAPVVDEPLESRLQSIVQRERGNDTRRTVVVKRRERAA